MAIFILLRESRYLQLHQIKVGSFTSMKYCCRAAPEINPVITAQESEILADLFKDKIDQQDPKLLHATAKRYKLNTFFPDAVLTLQDIYRAIDCPINLSKAALQRQTLQNQYNVVLTQNEYQNGQKILDQGTDNLLNNETQQSQHQLSSSQYQGSELAKSVNKVNSPLHQIHQQQVEDQIQNKVQWEVKAVEQSQQLQKQHNENAHMMLNNDNESQDSQDEEDGISSVVRQSPDEDIQAGSKKAQSSQLRKSDNQTGSNVMITKAEKESQKEQHMRIFEDHATFDNHSTSTGEKEGLIQFKEKEIHHASEGDFDKYEQIAAASGIENSVNPIFEDPKVMSTQLQPDIKDDTLSDEKEPQEGGDQAFVNDSNYNDSHIVCDIPPQEPGDVAFMTDFTTPASQISGTQNDSKISVPQSEIKHKINKTPVNDAAEVELLQRSQSDNYAAHQNAKITQEKANETKPPLKPTVQLSLSQSVMLTHNKTKQTEIEDQQIEFAGHIIGSALNKSKIPEKLVFRRMNNMIFVSGSDGTVIGQVSPLSKSISVDLKRLRITVALIDGKKVLIKCHNVEDIIKKQHKLYYVIGKIEIIECHNVIYNNIFNQLIIQSNYPTKRINVEGLQVQNHKNRRFSLYRNNELLVILRFQNEVNGKKMYQELHQLQEITFLPDE